jgi:hypothetical protein
LSIQRGKAKSRARTASRPFGSVFGEKARVVVVLYRNGWGETPWTRIEETAIRNRAFEEGYNFVKFIPLDEKATVPKWLPRTQLWLDLSRWGAEGAAVVIEARVQELGGQARDETVEERAARLARSLRFAENRTRLLKSQDGVTAANEEYRALREEVERLVTSINESVPTSPFRLKKAPNQIIVLGPDLGLSVDWRNPYSNTLDDSGLFAVVWNGHPPFPDVFHYEKPKKLWSETFNFDLELGDQRCWARDGDQRRTFQTKPLASHILKRYMDEVESRRR